jgi:hypothetical protein
MNEQPDPPVPNSSTSLAVVRGSAPRALARHEAKTLARRKAHDLVLVATEAGYANDPWFHWLGDLRRARTHVYGSLLRFIDLCAMKAKDGKRRVPKWMVKMIPQWIDSYIEDQYGDDDPGSTVKVA